MKANAPFSLFSPAQVAFFCFSLAALTDRVGAQIPPAWVQRYNNNLPAGQHQALKIALDHVGNIYVCGFSQNANSNLDYALLKYAPSGALLWGTRLDSAIMNQA